MLNDQFFIQAAKLKKIEKGRIVTDLRDYIWKVFWEIRPLQQAKDKQ